MSKEWISENGFNALVQEREHLMRVERPQVVQQVADAAAEGDRSENAEYIYGKKRMREIDRRLKYLSNRLEQVVIKSPPSQKKSVVFLSIVEVENLDTEEIKQFQIVGPDESDVNAGKVSYLSPIGRAILGKKVDDDFEFETPGGQRVYCVNKISTSSDQ